jgi:hypothetical protein
VSECAEGIGSQHYRAAQEKLLSLGPDAFLDTLLAKQFADVDEWQTEMLLNPMRSGTVYLYSTGLSVEDHSLTGVERIDAVTRAILLSVQPHDDTSVAVIPEEPYVVPIVGDASPLVV